MAHKKGAGSSNNGRESHSKRLGIKIFGGQLAIAGNIIVRQRGTNHHPDKGVGIGKDHTLFALVDGQVTFRKKHNNKSYVSVLPFSDPVAEFAEKPVAKKAIKAEAPVTDTPEKPLAKKATKEEVPVAEAATGVVEEKPAKAPKIKKEDKATDAEEAAAE